MPTAAAISKPFLPLEEVPIEIAAKASPKPATIAVPSAMIFLRFCNWTFLANSGSVPKSMFLCVEDEGHRLVRKQSQRSFSEGRPPSYCILDGVSPGICLASVSRLAFVFAAWFGSSSADGAIIICIGARLMSVYAAIIVWLATLANSSR